MGFREEYNKFPGPSTEREQFVLKTLKSLPREQIVHSMRPITVPGSGGTKITYKVMPDYLMVDGMRVPMSGNTAQQVANHFGLAIPTAQMTNEIYHNADVQVAANPLSGSGVQIGDRYYSGKDVVDKGVGYAPFAEAYNDRINQQLAEKGVNAGSGQIVSGFAKDIVQPPAKGKLGLHGFYDVKGNPIQGGSGETPHDTTVHTEYGAFARLVSSDAIITYPDGHTETKPLSDVRPTTIYEPVIRPAPGGSSQQYNPSRAQSGRVQMLARVDDYLSQLVGKI